MYWENLKAQWGEASPLVKFYAVAAAALAVAVALSAIAVPVGVGALVHEDRQVRSRNEKRALARNPRRRRSRRNIRIGIRK
jgi:hypothetical protein